MRNTALYIIAALLLVTSCNEALMAPQKMGTISLSLSSDVEVSANTKADAVDYSDFLVDIYGTTVLGLDHEVRYVFNEMPESVTIPYGYYNVSAQSCTEEKAVEGFGHVRYYGVSGQVKVLDETCAEAIVECRMVNGKVTMTIDRSFLDDFSDVTVDLTVGERKLTMTSDQANLPTAVYFNVPEEGANLVYRVYGTIAKGTEQERKLSYTNEKSPMLLLPAKWAKITVKSNHNGIIGPGVSVDSGMGNDSITEPIDPEQGDEVVNGKMETVSVSVDTDIEDATVLDCVVEV